MKASATQPSGPSMVTVIKPARGLELPRPSDIWHHRDLIYYLARRDVVVRYKQAFIGGSWAILQPVLLAAVFSVFLGRLAKVPSYPDIPYALFVVSGMVMWLFFAQALEKASRSTVENETLISKIYFPRLVIPVAAVIPPAVDFVVAFIVLVFISMAYGFFPSVAILAVPVFLAMAMATALGLGLWLSALNVKYRDVNLVVPFTLLLGLFITPVTYPADLVPDNLEALYAVNPMVGVLEGFRWSLLGTEWPGTLLLIPAASSVLFLIGGALYFQRAERSFADVI